jgi:serine/threonine-protein phosphatase 5
MGNPQEEATQLKNKGNEAFKNQDWANAVDFYTKAIELWDKEPSFYTNRAQVCSRIAATHSR